MTWRSPWGYPDYFVISIIGHPWMLPNPEYFVHVHHCAPIPIHKIACTEPSLAFDKQRACPGLPATACVALLHSLADQGASQRESRVARLSSVGSQAMRALPTTS